MENAGPGDQGWNSVAAMHTFRSTHSITNTSPVQGGAWRRCPHGGHERQIPTPPCSPPPDPASPACPCSMPSAAPIGRDPSCDSSCWNVGVLPLLQLKPFNSPSVMNARGSWMKCPGSEFLSPPPPLPSASHNYFCTEHVKCPASRELVSHANIWWLSEA